MSVGVVFGVSTRANAGATDMPSATAPAMIVFLITDLLTDFLEDFANTTNSRKSNATEALPPPGHSARVDRGVHTSRFKAWTHHVHPRRSPVYGAPWQMICSDLDVGSAAFHSDAVSEESGSPR